MLDTVIPDNDRFSLGGALNELTAEGLVEVTVELFVEVTVEGLEPAAADVSV